MLTKDSFVHSGKYVLKNKITEIGTFGKQKFCQLKQKTIDREIRNCNLENPLKQSCYPTELGMAVLEVRECLTSNFQ